MNFNKRLVLNGALTFIVLILLGCIEKPVSLDSNQSPAVSYTSSPRLNQIVIDTSGTYWGANYEWLFLFSADKFNNLSVVDSLYLGGNVNVVQNNHGLTIVKTYSELMYVKNISGKIVRSNISHYFSGINDPGIIDESGTLWFLSSDYVVLLNKWDGKKIDTLQVGNYGMENQVSYLAMNFQKVTFFLRSIDSLKSQEHMIRFDYDKKGVLTKKEYSPVSGEFGIRDLMYIDTTLFVVLRDYSKTYIKRFAYGMDSVFSLEGHDCLTTTIDSSFSFKYLIAFTDDWYGTRMIPQSPNVLWLVSNQSIRWFNATSVGEIKTENYQYLNLSFVKKGMVYCYSPQSGKVFRIDDQKGFVVKRY